MKGLLKEVMNVIKSPKPLFVVAAFYALIFLIAFAINKLLLAFLLPKKELLSAFMAILIIIADFLIMVFAYSFFKLGIIEIVAKKKLAKKSFNKVGSFFIFNLFFIVFAFFALSLLGSIITYSFNNILIAGTTFLVIFMIFCYPFFNFSQFEFVENGKILRSIGIGWKTLFSKIKKYLKLLLFDVLVSAIFLVAYILFFYGIGHIYKIAFITNNQNASFYISLYNVIFQIPLAIFFLLLSAVNVFLLKKIKKYSKGKDIF